MTSPWFFRRAMGMSMTPEQLLELEKHRTLYEILGVRKDAKKADIRAAYHRLVMRVHPDLADSQTESSADFDTHRENTDGQEYVNASVREEHLKLINYAYETLSNEDRRSEYDNFLLTAPTNPELNKFWKPGQRDYTDIHREEWIRYSAQIIEGRNRRKSRPLLDPNIFSWTWWKSEHSAPFLGCILAISVGIFVLLCSNIIIPDEEKPNAEALKKEFKEFCKNEKRKSTEENASESSEVAWSLPSPEADIRVVRAKSRTGWAERIGIAEKISLKSRIPYLEEAVLHCARRESWNERRPTYESEPIYINDEEPTTFVLWFSSTPDHKGRVGWFVTSSKYLKKKARFPLAFIKSDAPTPARIQGLWQCWEHNLQRYRPKSVEIKKIPVSH